MDVIDHKFLKGKFDTMNEMKLFRDRLGSFRRDLAYFSREVLQPGKRKLVCLFFFISYLLTI